MKIYDAVRKFPSNKNIRIIFAYNIAYEWKNSLNSDVFWTIFLKESISISRHYAKLFGCTITQCSKGFVRNTILHASFSDMSSMHYPNYATTLAYSLSLLILLGIG